MGGSRYYLCIIDDFYRKVWTYIIKRKDETFLKFKHWKAMVETQKEMKGKVLRTDNGLEFCGEEFNTYYGENGIQGH